jgi:predicted outer membrane repeat protein
MNSLLSGRTVRRARPTLETLEDRLSPAVINVVGIADSTAPVITAGHAGTAADPFLAPSLRSAISLANATPGGNTINLTVPGDYKLTLVGTAGETDNAAGELAILPGGGNLTIQNTSGGPVAVDGGNQVRVLDINPAFDFNNLTATPKFTVTLVGFTIQNGLAQPGDGPGGSGGGIRDQGNASLTLTDMVVTNNTASADGGGISMENTVSTPWTLDGEHRQHSLDADAEQHHGQRQPRR